MNHLTYDQLFDLGQRMVHCEPFTEAELADFSHIRDCEDCYQKLRILMQLQEDMENMDILTLDQWEPTPQRSGIIRIEIINLGTTLTQLRQQDWCFVPPVRGVRGTGTQEPLSILIDEENDDTFVAYDPAKQCLCIQIGDTQDGLLPMARLRHADGREEPIPLQRCGDCYRAEIYGLTGGSFELILEA